MIELQQRPHRRYNPLTRDWVLVSPHRTQRPWQGQTEKTAPPVSPSYDPACYLCPGNARAAGQHNPAYTTTFAFDNDFPALLPDTPPARLDDSGLLQARSERGACRVVCFSPDHSLTLARMTVAQIRPVVDTWAAEFEELLARPYINHVQIFENRGEMMGCSNPHPHCQIWAQESIPMEIQKELKQFKAYSSRKKRGLLIDYLKLELRLKDRVVFENSSCAVVIPYWAVWPYETMIIPKRRFSTILQLKPDERKDFAGAMRIITVKYDNLFKTSFPYSAGLHQAPTDGRQHNEWHFHMHFYPPLLRSAQVKKFIVGYEMLAEPQRDITPEQSAATLQKLSSVHYTIA
jgi:UDPglucose--hexose-1-phosphate uridylyltransferase